MCLKNVFKRGVYMAARDSKLMFRVTDDIKRRFGEIAESWGVTESALGAIVIGKFIEEEERKRDLQNELAVKAIDVMSTKAINSVELTNMMNQMVVALKKQQENNR